MVWSLVAGRLLFRLEDHGDTWEQRPLPPGYIATQASISFIDDQEGWVAAAGSHHRAGTHPELQGHLEDGVCRCF